MDLIKRNKRNSQKGLIIKDEGNNITIRIKQLMLH